MSSGVLPPFIYYGGKGRLAARIAAMLPEHTQYVEPFAGSLAVLLAKAPARLETVNDLDGDLMLFWRMLRDHPDELARVCALTPHSRAERDAALDRPAGLDDLERARRVWVCLSQGRSGTLRPTGWRFTVDDTAKVPMPRVLTSYVDRMTAAADRIRTVSLENRPALELIEAYGRHRNTVLYVDPPYLAQTRSVGGAHNYRHEMPRTDQHNELAAALTACRASVVLSGYPSPLYDKLYRGWHRYALDSSTSQGGTHQHRTEVNHPGLNIPGFGAHLFVREGWHHAEEVRRGDAGQGCAVGR
ncbi:DNA adenine methylase [Gordonia polyisoprenivorans]|uniref:DNA adenine methylase n=1 Tax=Gordonia polyisoprenivorans TaxID=84595 RepID=UPI0030CDD123